MMTTLNTGRATSYGASLTSDDEFIVAHREAARIVEQDRLMQEGTNWFSQIDIEDPQPEEISSTFVWYHDYNAKAVFVIGLMTTGLTLLEFIYAMLTGSLTLIADAFHRLSDVLTMACTFYAIILSRRSQSDKYSCELPTKFDLTSL